MEREEKLVVNYAQKIIYELVKSYRKKKKKKLRTNTKENNNESEIKLEN